MLLLACVDMVGEFQHSKMCIFHSFLSYFYLFLHDNIRIRIYHQIQAAFDLMRRMVSLAIGYPFAIVLQ